MSTSALCLLTALAAAGCAQDGAEGDDAAAELALDTGDSGASESELLVATVEDLPATTATTTAAEVAAALDSRLSARFLPAGCASSTASGASVAVTFDGCSGPRGLRQLDGAVTLTITAVTATTISLTAQSTDLQIGAAALELDLSATYTRTATAASLTVESSSGGVGPFGHSLEHTASYQVSWTATCASVAGTWSTVLDGRARGIEVDLQRCVDSCGVGEVTRTTRDGRVITLTLDGTSATWSSSTGRTGTVALRCGR